MRASAPWVRIPHPLLQQKGNTLSNQTNATASASSGGIGLFGLTFLVFLVLKVTGLWDISWFVVFSPLLIGFGLSILILVVVLVFMGIAVFFSEK